MVIEHKIHKKIKVVLPSYSKKVQYHPKILFLNVYRIFFQGERVAVEPISDYI